jgi:hypothetical protein
LHGAGQQPWPGHNDDCLLQPCRCRQPDLQFCESHGAGSKAGRGGGAASSSAQVLI